MVESLPVDRRALLSIVVDDTLHLVRRIGLVGRVVELRHIRVLQGLCGGGPPLGIEGEQAAHEVDSVGGGGGEASLPHVWCERCHGGQAL
eukprot:scaffold61765_cov60-Phaeocystis_antarctica.AAC.4